MNDGITWLENRRKGQGTPQTGTKMTDSVQTKLPQIDIYRINIYCRPRRRRSLLGLPLVLKVINIQICIEISISLKYTNMNVYKYIEYKYIYV